MNYVKDMGGEKQTNDLLVFLEMRGGKLVNKEIY